MKKIILLTATNTRYGNILHGLRSLSENQFEITNNFFPTKTLTKFEKNKLLQLFFNTPDLLIIDQNIIINTNSGHLTLLKKIFDFKIFDEKTKILVLLNREAENNSKQFSSFVFTENAKATDVIHELFLKVKEILK